MSENSLKMYVWGTSSEYEGIEATIVFAYDLEDAETFLARKYGEDVVSWPQVCRIWDEKLNRFIPIKPSRIHEEIESGYIIHNEVDLVEPESFFWK